MNFLLKQIFLLIILFQWTSVYAVLPPGAAEQLQKKASDHVGIAILNVDDSQFSDSESYPVTYQAKVLVVYRSATHLKQGDIITIHSYHSVVPIFGPRVPTLLSKGWTGEAYLNVSESAEQFNIAAYGHSFIEKHIPGLKDMSSIDDRFQMNLQKGWNLISLPVNCDSQPILSVASAVFSFKNNSYALPDKLEPGNGYWVKIIEPVSLNLSGTPFTEYSIEISNYWQLLGTIHEKSVPVISPDDAVLTFYGYINGTYQPVNEFEPGSGYWVKANKNAVLTVKKQDDRPQDDNCSDYIGIVSKQMIGMTPRDNYDAEILAIKATNSLVAPQDVYERVARDLTAIRLNDSVSDIHCRLDYSPSSMLISFNDNRSINNDYTQLDCMNEYYGLIEKSRRFTGSYKYVYAGRFDISLLADEYSKLPDVKYAEPNYYYGDGDNICLSIRDGVYSYVFKRGWGDCPSGCMYEEYLGFTSNQNGSIETYSANTFDWNLCER